MMLTETEEADALQSLWEVGNGDEPSLEDLENQLHIYPHGDRPLIFNRSLRERNPYLYQAYQTYYGPSDEKGSL